LGISPWLIGAQVAAGAGDFSMTMDCGCWRHAPVSRKKAASAGRVDVRAEGAPKDIGP
jgi:hypothetical protein